MHIVVTGGNGFIGRRVCECAAADGHEVTSIARSGPPAPAHCGTWAEAVNWVAADVFAPHEWRSVVADADRVVHSIGTFSEAPRDGVTLERLNGDSAIVAALEAERAGIDRFVYVSSSNRPPLVREAYITARRRAEAAIADLDVETVVPRFGPVYGPAQPHFPGVVNRLFAAVGAVDRIAEAVGEDRPFSVEAAGRAIYRLTVRPDPPDSPVTATALADLAGRR